VLSWLLLCPLFGLVAKPLLTPAGDGECLRLTPFRDEVCHLLLWRGFLLPSGTILPPSEVGGSPISLVQSMLGCSPLLSFSEVCESSGGSGFEEIGGPLGVAIDLFTLFINLFAY